MGMMDRLRGIAKDAQNAVEGEISRFRNKDALDALIGASVMIAAADGKITSDEKQKLLGFLQNSALTKSYSVDQIMKTFEDHTRRFDWDVEVGQAEALRIVGRQRDNVETARAIARLAVMIARADGDFDAREREVAVRIVQELGLPPADFL